MPPTPTDYAREAIERAGGLVSTTEAADILGVSRQSLSRRFMRARRAGSGAFPEPVTSTTCGHFWTRESIEALRTSPQVDD